MGLSETVRNAILAASSVTRSLQVTVMHLRAAGLNERAEQQYGEAIPRLAIVELENEMVLEGGSRQIQSQTVLTFLAPVEVSPADRIILPDGTHPPVIRVENLLDDRGKPYMTQVRFN